MIGIPWFIDGILNIRKCFQVGWFSFDPEFHVEREQMCCYLTRTTKSTHLLIKENLHETPTYGGWVEAKGPRYCPSIEDKVRFYGPCCKNLYKFTLLIVNKYRKKHFYEGLDLAN